MSDNMELIDTELSDLDWRAMKAFNELPSYTESSDTESGDMEFDYVESMESVDDSKSPAIAESHRFSLSYLRQLCDLCMKPPDDECMGALITITNAGKLDNLRDLAELALKFYNDTKLKNFKLVKFYKMNVGSVDYGLTFRAQEDESEECPLFRGAVHCVGGEKAVFCEIKDDDEVTLPPGDDDYVRSEGSCDSKDSRSPLICDNMELIDTELSDLDWRAMKAFDELPSYTESSDTESSDMEFNYVESRESVDDSKSPAIAESHRFSLSYLRQLCDLCMKPPDDECMGAFITIANAGELDNLRDLAELALKFYNDTKLKNFKLVKFYKMNVGSVDYGLTFRAQEDESEECPLFRGVVHCTGGEKAVFCEIKDDDEITLPPGDDDYVSEGSCDSKDSRSPLICENDPGDSSPANSGDGSFAGSEVSEGSSK